MLLEEIYYPIKKELIEVERVMRTALSETEDNFISEMSNYLLEGKGKRLRPALVLLSAKASRKETPDTRHLINVAAAMELIHMASLVHDDIVDKAKMRYNRPTVNSKWGQDVSLVLGDYLYSVAFEFISECENSDIIRCIGSATRAMCEGEFLQVCGRDNLEFLKEQYIVVVKKKTASLFAASCQVGTLVSNSGPQLLSVLREYGLNIGVAFQIVDDYLDLVGDEKNLGKTSGQDILSGEVTLPILNLLESVSPEERAEVKTLLASKGGEGSIREIRSRLLSSEAPLRTKKEALSFINPAKEKISDISSSPYKESLLSLADFIVERGFNDIS